MGVFLFFLLLALPLQAADTSFCCDHVPPLFSLHSSDKFQFGRLWSHIKHLEEQNLLYEMIHQRRREISTIKTHWGKKISSFEEPSFLTEIDTLLQLGSLQSSNVGCGAAYFLFDQNNKPLYVIKPFDEDILCLNNRKNFASPYNNSICRVRNHIPLYRTFQAEALSYAMAAILGLEHLIPPTHLAILSHEKFYDISQSLGKEEQEKLFAAGGIPDKEKLCSVQAFLPGTKNLYTLVEEWLAQNLTEEDITALIDPEDFENLVILIWVLFDTDAHAGNIYAKKDAAGLYHLIKIDNGLTFPDQNSHLLNALYFFPQAKKPLSERACKLIQNLPVEKMLEKITFFEMKQTLDAFSQRILVLQQLCRNKAYTIREIDARLRALELPQGEQIAVSSLSLEQLEKIICYE